jgi:hypothetical protein
MTQDAKTIAVHRAVTLLRASGARFGVEFNGEVLGSPLMPLRMRKTRDSNGPPRHELEKKYGYVAKMDALEPGASVKIKADNVEELRALQRAASARGGHNRGPGGVVTHANSATLEIEVLAINPLMAKETAMS